MKLIDDSHLKFRTPHPKVLSLRWDGTLGSARSHQVHIREVEVDKVFPERNPENSESLPLGQNSRTQSHPNRHRDVEISATCSLPRTLIVASAYAPIQAHTTMLILSHPCRGRAWITGQLLGLSIIEKAILGNDSLSVGRTLSRWDTRLSFSNLKRIGVLGNCWETHLRQWLRAWGGIATSSARKLLFLRCTSLDHLVNHI